MKDYSELKGLPVKIKNHTDNLKFKDCHVAEIDDCGLIIVGHVITIPPPLFWYACNCFLVR